MSEDPMIDILLDQAASYAKKRLDDESFVDFDFTCTNTTSPIDILNGKHDLIEMREEKGGDDHGSEGGQRGMYAKCDIKAGANLVIAKPIVVCWDVEDDDSDDDDDIDDDELEGMMQDQLGSDDSGDDDDSVDEDGDEVIDMEAESKKFSDSNEDERKVSSLKTSESDHGDDINSDDDDDSIQEGATGTKRNGILILRSLEKIKETPSLWTNTLSKLFPRDVDSALTLPPWFCGDASIGMEIETQCNKLASLSLFPSRENEEMCKEIVTRLPLIVRYNVLSLETCSELFVYPDVTKGGLASLAGTGLYGPEVSYLNHSCVPNVSRYCIGDVMFFVTNRDVTKGEELCYSYIEHEFLCENASKRSALLDMDFELEDTTNGGIDHNQDNGERPNKKQKVAKMPSSKEEDEVHYPLIDAETQSELMASPATERLELINELLDQKADPVQDYQCDKYQLHILKAITLDELGKSNVALPEWEMAVDFAVTNFPPLDETTIALRVQAALCALKGGVPVDNDKSKAKCHAGEALKVHNSLFGGGTKRFLKRYEKEFSCPMRLIPAATMLMNVQELFG